MMNIDEFAQNIKEWRSRVTALLQNTDGAKSSTSANVQSYKPENSTAQMSGFPEASLEASELPDEQAERLIEAYEQLNIAAEELQVAQEELYQQNEELTQNNQVLAIHNQELEVAHQSVQAERQRYQELFEFAPDGYLITDAEGTIQEVNRAAADLFTFSQRFLVGKSLVSFVHDSERLTFTSQLAIASKENRVREWEVRLQPRKRWYVDVSLKVAPVRDKEGKLVGLRWLLRDITDYKQAKSALQRANEQLKTEIAERQKAEALAREALESEKELSELKTRFIGMVSHEYRTPLTIILSSAELLERYSDRLTQEKKFQHLKRIENQVHHLTQLVDDVLFINQVEAQSVKVKPTLLDVPAFCQEVVEDLKLKASMQQSILFESQGNFNQVYLDPKLLRQILSNLLSNAIKYSPQGGTVRLSCIGDTDQLTFCIQDEGIGIPSEDLPKLMQSFYRATNAGTSPGTGLGLAIVKKCVELHGGQITVDSQLGIGTTFKITLPVNYRDTTQE
jgi:two-component system, OmpR family, sensor histidine kinase VicK